MKYPSSLNRRQFLQAGLLGSAAFATTTPLLLLGQNVPVGPDAFRGLKVGIASYTYRKFNLDQAIAMTKEAGVKYICLKDVHLPLKSSKAERQEAHRKIEAGGLTLLGGGVIYISNQEDEVRNVFEYARDAGMPTIICSPDPAAMDTVEKMAKEFDIRIAIHNHGPTDKRYPSPLDVLQMVKDRDPLMGICLDDAHTVRIGQDPVAVIKQCAGRLYDFHMKDVSAATAQGSATEAGKGVIDIPAVLKTLIGMKFPYHVALEYEAHGDAPQPGVMGFCNYMRQVLAPREVNHTQPLPPFGTPARTRFCVAASCSRTRAGSNLAP